MKSFKDNFPYITLVSLDLLQANTGQIEGVPPNPRTIKNKEFEDLKRSILVFPQMLYLRPITYVGDNYAVLGGNQRRAALDDIAKLSFDKIIKRLQKYEEFTSKEPDEIAQITEYWREFAESEDKPVPAQSADGLTPEQMQEFVIKDNVQFGDNDWEIMANEWDIDKVSNWGAEIPKGWGKEDTPEITDKAENTKRSIQISFETDDYVEAYRLIQWFRDNEIYLGKHAINWLSDLKKNEYKNHDK